MLMGAFSAAAVAMAGWGGTEPEKRVETPRPVLHFTAEKNWLNDPNGLIFVDGEYHLFYQYNPLGDQWGHMSWGHAVSRDLLAWEHLPVAIPEADGVMAFSGTAVLDTANTSGFGKQGRPPLVAVYTGHDEKKHRQFQNIASSVDGGRTFTRYAGNPVVDVGVSDFRDPKVFWHEKTRKWVMAVSLANDRRVLFYGSKDLKAWEKLSEFGPAGQKDVPNWECPDLFEMEVDEETDSAGKRERRWVLVVNVGGGGPGGGSGTQYFVGKFDGATFVNDNPPDKVLWLDRGPDFYAFQSFNYAPGGKRVGMAWMVNTHYAGATPTAPWRGEMTVPREFWLARTRGATGDGKGAEKLRVAQRPIEGIEKFLKERGGADGGELMEKTIGRREIGEGETSLDACADVAVIRAELVAGTAKRVGVRVRVGRGQFTSIGIDATTSELFVDRRSSGRVDVHPGFAGETRVPITMETGKPVLVTIVVDRTSVEVFSGDGLSTIGTLVFPDAASRGISVFAEGGKGELVRMWVVGRGK